MQDIFFNKKNREGTGHLRRYTASRLKKVLEDACFRVKKLFYYQSLFMPFIIASRLLGRHWHSWRDFEEKPPPTVNKLIKYISRIEVRLGELIPWPWGLSLMALCNRE